MKNLLAFVLAGALMAPTTGLTSENAFRDDGTRQASTKFPEKLPFPPIAQLETMPWLNFDVETKGLKVDSLLPPSFVVPAFPRSPAFGNNDVFNTRQLLAGTGFWREGTKSQDQARRFSERHYGRFERRIPLEEVQ